MRQLTRPVAAVLSIAAPVTLTVYRWEWISHHQLVSILLSLVYFVLLLLTNLLGQVWIRLRSTWAERLSNRIDGAATRLMSGFEGRYLDFVAQTHRFVDQKGLATLGERTPELNDVFVDVSLAMRSPHQVSGAVLSEPPAHVTERRSIWEFLDRRPRPCAILALIGAPGSGKTTLLRHVAAHLSQGGRQLGVPALLLLRESAAIITRAPDITLAKVICANIEGILDPIPDGWFELQLAAGHCVVMFDGLDEVALQEHRQLIVDWVDRQIARYPLNDFLITSRPHGYQEYPLERAAVLQVRGFTIAQITRFVHGWYLAAERYSTGSADEVVERLASEEADNLLSKLRDSPALAELASNPLLLTMIVNVHRYRGALPGTRAELYAEMCVVLLGRRQQAKKLVEPIRLDQKEVVLRELAFTMMTETVRDLPGDRITAIIGEVLPRVSVSLGPREFLAEIRANGILLELERGIYCFAHHTFQEYFAAAHIRERNKIYALASTVGDPWWRETALLYVARGDAGPIVEACLNSQRIPALTLAFDCADAASELSLRLRAKLESILSHAADPQAPPEQRSLAAAVTASRSFRNTVALDGGGRAIAMPIRGELYKLFRSDHGMPRIARFIEPQSFVNWINRLLDGHGVYRLLTDEEVNDSAITMNAAYDDAYFWCAAGGNPDQIQLRVPPGKRNPYAVSLPELLRTLQCDSTGPIRIAATCYLALSLVRYISSVHILCLTHARVSGDKISVALARDMDLALAFANEIADDICSELTSDRASRFLRSTATYRNLDHQAAAAQRNAAPLQSLGEALNFATTIYEALDAILEVELKVNIGVDTHIRRAKSQNVFLDFARSRSSVLRRALVSAHRHIASLGCDVKQPDDSGTFSFALADMAPEVCSHLALSLELDEELAELDRFSLSMVAIEQSDFDCKVGTVWWVLLARAIAHFDRPFYSTARLSWLRSCRGVSEPDECVIYPSGLTLRAEMGAANALQFGCWDDNSEAMRCVVSLAGNLIELIRIVVSSESVTSVELITFMRLTALALALSLHQPEREEQLAASFIDIAIGITGLDQQNRAADRVTETIGLATA